MTVSIDPAVDMQTPPLDQVKGMSAEVFFDRGLSLMRLHPPHLTDWSLIGQMRCLGPVAGASVAGLDPGVRELLQDVPAQALQLMQQAFPRVAMVVNGWQMNIETMGVYGNFYLKRAIVAMVGLGANAPEDAGLPGPVLMADADGQPVTGDHDYVLHFGQTEPWNLRQQPPPTTLPVVRIEGVRGSNSLSSAQLKGWFRTWNRLLSMPVQQPWPSCWLPSRLGALLVLVVGTSL